MRGSFLGVRDRLPHRRFPISRLFLLSLLAVVSTPAAEVRDVSLTIGQGWALVRELRQVSLGAGTREILLDELPEEADLSSLRLRMRRVPIRLLEWERVPRPEGLQDPTLRREGETIWWRPGPGWSRGGAEAPRPVRCRLESPLQGERVLELCYRVTGFSWRAVYQVAIRGKYEAVAEPVSVDFLGELNIVNGSTRSFPNATIHLVGEVARETQGPDEGPGFLILTEENPNSAWWRPPPEAPSREREYQVPVRASLTARGETVLVMTSGERMPARRLFALASEDLGEREEPKPMRRLIVFDNRSTRQQGWNLPEGPVTVFAGARRSRILQQGWLPHTRAQAELRISLGLEDRVRARMRSFGSAPISDRSAEERFEIVLENRMGIPVQTEFVAEPPYASKWDVVRSSQNYVLDRGRLRFTPVIDGYSDTRIEYKLRVEQ